MKPSELNKLKKLEAHVRQLERALAQSTMATMCLEQVIVEINADYGIDAKKKYDSELSQQSFKETNQ